MELERVAEQRSVADEHERVPQPERGYGDQGEPAPEACDHARTRLRPARRSSTAAMPAAASTISGISNPWRSRGTP